MKNEDMVADVAQCERISIKCNALAFSNNIDRLQGISIMTSPF